MSALINTQTRQLRAQLLGAMVCRPGGQPRAISSPAAPDGHVRVSLARAGPFI